MNMPSPYAAHPHALAFRLSAVARIAGAPVETIRSRLRAGLLGDHEHEGWRTFTLADAALVAFHSEIKQMTGDDALAAALLAEVAPPLGAYLDDVDPGDDDAFRAAFSWDVFAVCVRAPGGGWEIETADGPYQTDAAMSRRTAETFSRNRFFVVINVGAVLRAIAARIAATPAAVAAAAPVTTSSRNARHA